MDVRIIEIKSRCAHPEKVENILISNGATASGVDHQVDTYFDCNTGRLKLRVGNIEKNLIQYNRDESQKLKDSKVSLYPVDGKPENLRETLGNALGIINTVDKKRKIFWIDNVKFHIDEVKDLGTFVEIEAIGKGKDTDIEKLADQCNHYIDLLELHPKDFIKESYIDLINHENI